MNNIDIQDIVKLVNDKLSKGSSIASIEKEMKLGKDVLRKRLNRAGYKFSKENKCFELKDNTENNTDSSNIKTYSKASDIKASLIEHNSNKNVIKTVDEHNCNTTVTKSKTESISEKEIDHKEDIPSAKLVLTENQFKTLLKMIDEYETREQVKEVKYNKSKDNLVSRTFRCYKDVLEDFSAYCKSKDLVQRDAIADALIFFMKINN